MSERINAIEIIKRHNCDKARVLKGGKVETYVSLLAHASMPVRKAFMRQVHT